MVNVPEGAWWIWSVRVEGKGHNPTQQASQTVGVASQVEPCSQLKNLQCIPVIYSVAIAVI